MYNAVSNYTFGITLRWARRVRPLIQVATTSPDEIPYTNEVQYYLADDHRSGFGIDGGELIAVFAIDKGKGDALMAAAKDAGAKFGNCFDGYLVEFYKRHGWHETGREANWTPGGPDVVFLEA